MDGRGEHSRAEEEQTGGSHTPPTRAPSPPSSHGSWAQDDHRAPVAARRPGLGRRLQLRLDRQPVPDHRLDEAGLGRGESTAGIAESPVGWGDLPPGAPLTHTLEVRASRVNCRKRGSRKGRGSPRYPHLPRLALNTFSPCSFALP